MKSWYFAFIISFIIMHLPQASEAKNLQSFADVSACVALGHFKRTTCAEAFEDAWEVYKDRTPRFKTRESCNAKFKVCVVFNPPGSAGRPAPRLTVASLAYAPPLLGVVLSPDGFAIQVLVDTTRKPLGVGVPSRRSKQINKSSRSFSGDNFAPPSGNFNGSSALTLPKPAQEPLTSPNQLQIDAPGAASLEGVSSYPVPENRRRKR